MPRDPIRHRRRLAIEPLEGRALLAALMVTNTLDSGAGSLRQAITEANAASSPSTIDFAIAGSGVHTIGLLANLPTITAPVTVDATTQPGYAGSPLVAIDGKNVSVANFAVATGLNFGLGSSGSVVRGLAIDRFADGITVGHFTVPGAPPNGPRVTIDSDDFGLDPATGQAAGNGTGITVFGGNGPPTSDPSAGPGTAITNSIIVASTLDGIDLFGPVNGTVSGNFIGTDRAGRAGLGNAYDGISASAPAAATTITGNTIADNGVRAIANSAGAGLTITGNTLTNNGVLTAGLAVTASTTSVTTATGQSRTITYTVTNNGPATATNATLDVISRFVGQSVDDIFAKPSPVFQFTGATVSRGTVGPGTGLILTTPGGPQSEGASFGDLAPGASASLTVTVKVIGSGTDTIDATATSQNPFITPFEVGASTAINGTGTADLAVAALPPAPARVGSPETFTFVVTNHDSSYSTDALFALRFSAPLFYPGIGSAPGSTQTGALVSQGTVTAMPSSPLAGYLYGGDLGPLAPGASAVVTAVIVPPVGGVVSAALYAYSANDVDPTPANNLAYAAAQATGVAPASSAPALIGADAVTSSATGPVTSIQVNFQGPLNASQAQDVRNYALTAAGSTARIKVQSATYAVTTLGFSVVTLRLARALPRTGAPLQLVVAGPGSPGLTGANGSPRLPAKTLTITR